MFRRIAARNASRTPRSEVDSVQTAVRFQISTPLPVFQFSYGVACVLSSGMQIVETPPGVPHPTREFVGPLQIRGREYSYY